MRPTPDPVVPEQGSVWRYPRPAVAEPGDRHVRIEHRGVLVTDTHAAVRTPETSRPPSWYSPPSDLDPGLRHRSERRSSCEWKGHAVWRHLAIGDELLRGLAWSDPEPTRTFAALHDHVAFYAGALHQCTVDAEQVRPQPGRFYGGWITSGIAGPFKGVSDSMGW